MLQQRKASSNDYVSSTIVRSNFCTFFISSLGDGCYLLSDSIYLHMHMRVVDKYRLKIRCLLTWLMISCSRRD